MTTEVHEHEVAVDRLAPGLFVSRLDRDWVGTPFPLQGFTIRTPEHLEALKRHCRTVFVDLARSLPDARRRLLTLAPTIESRMPWAGRAQYPELATLEEEAPRAKAARDNAEALASRLLDDLRAGRNLTAQEVGEVVMPIVESVVRNPDAFFWIDWLRKHDEPTYSHAITCCALAAAFGRHMGFPEDMLASLATGAFLLDVGKTLLPPELQRHAGRYGDAEHSTMREHVAHSLSIIDRVSVVDPHVEEMVRTHHERLDGSGYPKGLVGEQIPLFGRIAALIDSFDAMTSERPYRAALSRHDALQSLYRERGSKYEREVVEQFIQCVGAYPTGTLVELNTGEVAVVIAQNRARALRPRLLMLLDPQKNRNPGFPQLDLMLRPELVIVKVLPPDAYGLDRAELYL